jgi:hypothetical protein
MHTLRSSWKESTAKEGNTAMATKYAMVAQPIIKIDRWFLVNNMTKGDVGSTVF